MEDLISPVAEFPREWFVGQALQRILPAWLAIALVSLAAAQNPVQPADPLVAARARLQAALAKTATSPDTAFVEKWAEDGKKKDAGAVVVLGFHAGGAPTEVTGSWHAGLIACKYSGDTEDELVVAGRRTIAKASGKGWALRRGRCADGNTVDFVPDPEQLLELLASWNLVVRRETGSLDDRPMEILLVTLSADQVAEAAWSGLVPAALLNFGSNPFAMMAALQQGAARPAAATPTAMVDLAITFDPATSLIHQLRFRSWTKQDQIMMGGRVVVARAQAAVQVQGAVPLQGFKLGGAEEEDEDDEAKEGDAAKADSPLKY